MTVLAERQAARSRESDLSRRDGVFDISDADVATYTWPLTVSSLRVRTTDDGGIVVTLPGVNEAKGRFLTAYMEAFDTATVTFADAGDDGDFTNVVLGADKERVLFYSDGTRWFALTGDDAPTA